jgi:HK97 family phage prohead protease
MALIHKTNVSDFDQGLGCVLSDLSVDAYGDIVGDANDPNLGWNLDDFKKNPIALWSHSSRDPIGTWTDLHVKDRALRGHLHLAPPGSTKLVDELRALLAAGVVKGISVGFMPLEYKPRGNNGGTHYLRQKLVEASLCAVPANPSALLTAKALGISRQTIAMIFKPTDTSSTAQRIRKARKGIRKAKALLQQADTPHKRATLQRAIAMFEKEEQQLRASMEPRMTAVDRRLARALETRAKALATVRRIDERIAAEYDASAAGQAKRHQQEIIEAFTRASNRLPQDPPPFVPSGDGYGTWRGQKLPGPLWRGKPIR